jgi:hypothetical protein
LQVEVADARRAFFAAISAIREQIQDSVTLLESGKTGEARALLLHQIEVLKAVERTDEHRHE